MKVAFVCNANNHFFSMVRLLRDEGVDAHLVTLGNEERQFHPSWDTFDLSYQQYTHPVSWGDPGRFSAVDPAEVRRDLCRYGFTVVCGAVPGFMHGAGLVPDVVVPHGNDIAELPHFRLQAPRRGSLTSTLRFPLAQKHGLQSARFLGGAYTPQFEEIFAKLGCRGRRVAFPIAPIYSTQFNPDRISEFFDQTAWFHEFKRIRDTHEVVVFHHLRHIWKSRTSAFAQKGNDKLIRGFADFVQRHPDVRAALTLVEYGPDVEASRELIKELGIEKNAFWFPLMPRKEVMVAIALSDIVCGQFGLSWNFAGTIIEGIAMGKPLLHHRDDSMYPSDDLFPIMNVHSAEEISGALADYVVRPAHYKQMGHDALTWFRTRILKTSIDRFITLIETRR